MRSSNKPHANAFESVKAFIQFLNKNAYNCVSEIGSDETNFTFRTRPDASKCCILDAFERVSAHQRIQTRPHFGRVRMRLHDFGPSNTRKCCVLDALKRGKPVSSKTLEDAFSIEKYLHGWYQVRRR